MRTGSEAISIERLIKFVYIIATWYSQGINGLSGFSKFYGPLRGCQTRASAVNTNAAVASSVTNSNGNWSLSVPQSAGTMFRVFVGPNTSSSCVDLFTNLQPPFMLSAAAPTDSTSVRVGFISHAALAYLDLGPASPPNTTATLSANNITAVRGTLTDLYNALNISLSSYDLDPLSLDALAQLASSNATTRALGVALLAAEAQLGALVTLGTALLQAVTPAATAASSNSTTLSRLVSAEGMQQLLFLEEQRQQELAAAAAAVAAASAPMPAAAYTGVTNDTWAANSTDDYSLGSLYMSDVVRVVLTATATRAGLTLQSYAVNATADVVAGMVQYLEELKEVALREVAGERLGLNPLNAVITLARLTVVQAEAAAQMSALLGSNRDVMLTYVLDALPERLSKAVADVAAIHTYLGLPAPAASGPANGVAHLVGPLASCEGQASSIWTPDYQTLVTSETGSLQLQNKGSGFVTVSSYRYCQDELTGLRLGLTLSNLGPAAPAVSVSPVGMLAQGFYTLAASQGLATPSQEYQRAAFSAMGLNLTAYNALMIQPLNGNTSRNSTAPPLAPSPPSPPPSPSPGENSMLGNASNQTGAGSSFNLSHPLMPAIIAANTQLVGVVYGARALFARSCGVAYGLDSEENYNTFTATLATYAVALQGLDGARLNLSSVSQLNAVFSWLAAACYFNSSADAIVPVSTTGSFLSGGGGSAVGTARSSTAAARTTMPSVNTSTGSRRRQLVTSQQGGRVAAVDLTITSDGGAGDGAGLRRRRRVHADLLSLGVLGLQGLGPGTPRKREPARPADVGEGEGMEQAEVVTDSGELAAAGAVGPVTRGRVLAVDVGNPDITTVYTQVSEILSGINAELQAVHNASTEAAASPSAAASNLTDLLVRASQLGYVLQEGLYVELNAVLIRNYSSGLTLVKAVGTISERYKGKALQQRMQEAYFSKALVCGASGAMCGPSYPPPPSTPAGNGEGAKKSNKLLYVVAGVAGGVGALVAGVAGVLTYRAMRNRQVKRTVINNFTRGDMTNLESRVPSAAPPSALYGGMTGPSPFSGLGMGAGGGRSALGTDSFVPVVPAALGSDPRVALDYPLYPYRGSMNNHPMPSAAINAGQRNAVSATTVSATTGPRHTGQLPPLPTARTLPASLPSTGLGSTPSQPSPQAHPSQQQLLHGSHTSQQPCQQQQQQQQQQPYPQPPPLAEQLSASAPYVRLDGSNGVIHHGGPSRAGSGGGAPPGFKLYNNTALVHGAADASAFMDNGVGLSPAASTLGTHQMARAGSHALSASQLRSAPSTGLPDRRSARPPQPLAPYTAVSNTAAPTASLNSSLRAIPVNAHFNSSLRPPGAGSNTSVGAAAGPQRRNSNVAHHLGHHRDGDGLDAQGSRHNGSGGGGA